MSYQVLARKWRPRTFDELVGQGHVVRALSNALDQDRLHHAFLFTGTRGVGKTTVARILAKALNCLEGVGSQPCGRCEACRGIDEGRFVDLIEVDAASRTKVDDTRELLDNVQYAPSSGRYKVYLIDEVHMLSSHSFNALLKTLEEPPPHVKFLLATTDPQKLPVTVLSRCLRFNLKPLAMEAQVEHLNRLLAAEGVECEPGAVSLVARAAEGSVRDALSLLDQAIAFGGGTLREAEVVAMLGSVGQRQVAALMGEVADGDAAAVLARVAELSSLGPDPAQLLGEVISLLHQVAVAQMVPEAISAVPGEEEAIRRLAERLAPEAVQLHYQIALHGRRDLALAPDARAGLEMALLRMVAFRPDDGTPAVPRATPGQDAPSAPESAPAPATAESMVREPAASVAEAPTPAETPAPAPAPAPAPEPLAGMGSEEPAESPPLADVAAGDPSDLRTWSRWVDTMPVQSMVREMLRHTVWRGREGPVIRLALDAQRDFLNTSRNVERVVSALQTFLQEEGLEVRLAVEPELHTPAALREQDQQAAQARAEATIAADPVVNTLCETFSATVEADSVRPPDARDDGPGGVPDSNEPMNPQSGGASP